MSTGVIFILGKGVCPILASGVKSTWPQGSSAPGFSTSLCISLKGQQAGNGSYYLSAFLLFIISVARVFIGCFRENADFS